MKKNIASSFGTTTLTFLCIALILSDSVAAQESGPAQLTLQRSVANGPSLAARKGILLMLSRANPNGNRIAEHRAAFADIEAKVRAGASQAEIEPLVTELDKALRTDLGQTNKGEIEEKEDLQSIIAQQEICSRYSRNTRIHRPVLSGEILVKGCKGIRIWNWNGNEAPERINDLNSRSPSFGAVISWISRQKFVQDEFPWNLGKSEVPSWSIFLFGSDPPPELPRVPIPESDLLAKEGYIVIPLGPEEMGVSKSEFEDRLKQLRSIFKVKLLPDGAASDR